MMHLWKPDMIRFMRDASEYTNYNRLVAAAIAPHLDPEETLCDCGAGLGYLAMELAPFVRSVTLKDKNPDAMRTAAELIAEKRIPNAEAVCEDMIDAPSGAAYDDLLFSFFGRLPETLRIAKRICKNNVFVVIRTYSNHRFSVRETTIPSGGADAYCAALEVLGVPVARTDVDADFGQPFRSFEDARLFYRLYGRDDASAVTDGFLRSKLVARPDDSVFPFYVPSRRAVAILRYKAADVPDDWEDRLPAPGLLK